MEKTSTFEYLPEQRLYANILFYLSLIVLFILLTGFSLYLTGVITPIVPLENCHGSGLSPLMNTWKNQICSPDGGGYQTLGMEISLRCLV